LKRSPAPRHKVSEMSQVPIALQMYTVRDDAASDFAGTLRKVADTGYAGVELAGTGGMPASALRALLQDLGLQIAGSHVSLQMLEDDLNAVLDYNSELGNPRVVCPWLAMERRTAEGYRALAESLNRVGAACRERGMELCYHNHDFEFERFDGQTGFDILFGSTDPGLVKIELDTFWAVKGGYDAAEIIRKYAGRIPLIHLKDMTDDDEKTFAEVGEGTMDWPSIFAAGDAAGAAWYIVEQDKCARPPLESIRISLDNLRKMGRV
jgi:sugar phosphate isomerase/epimerase